MNNKSEAASVSTTTHIRFSGNASEDFTTTTTPDATVTSYTEADSLSGLDLLASHPLFQAAVWVYRTTLVVILVAGIVGNTMTLVLQRRVAGKDSQLSVFIASLAVSDLVMLLSTGAAMYLYSYRVFVMDLNDALCKLFYWSIYVVTPMSAWILVAMTVQRAASILWPHRVGPGSAGWTARGAWVAVLVIVVSSLLASSHALYGRRLETLPASGRRLCLYVSDDYRRFFNEVWPAVDIALSSLLPFALIIAANVVLVRRVRQSLREARRTLAAGSTRQLKVRARKTSSMTLTLVCVSLAFLVLTSPICVFAVVQRTGGGVTTGADVDEAAGDFLAEAVGNVLWLANSAINFLAEAVGNVLWLANSAINFYIYALTGSRYRQALASMCGCRHAATKNAAAAATSATRSMVTSVVTRPQRTPPPPAPTSQPAPSPDLTTCPQP